MNIVGPFLPCINLSYRMCILFYRALILSYRAKQIHMGYINHHQYLAVDYCYQYIKLNQLTPWNVLNKTSFKVILIYKVCTQVIAFKQKEMKGRSLKKKSIYLLLQKK